MSEEKETGVSRKLKVLMVDDSEAAAKTMGLMIELLGHDVRLVYDGPSAIEQARHYLPDVVLLDIGLPGMNGYETCRLMKQEAQLGNTLFIAQTGWGQSEHRKMSQEAGFKHHLLKPVSMEILSDILSNYSRETTTLPLRNKTTLSQSQIEMMGK